MKICVAQTKPVKCNIEKNIAAHKQIITLAVAQEANMIIFPELSITGYEPELAKELSTNEDDVRFNDFQEISDNNLITIGIGMPLNTDKGIAIGMIIFQPHQPRQVYTKQYLHSDELPFFIAEQRRVSFPEKENISLAICYEISVPEHVQAAHKSGAKIYIASVAKSATGVEKAIESLSATAKKYSMIVFMSNCIGQCDNMECGGKSSVWNNRGELLAQLNDINEGILILNTSTLETIKAVL